MELKVCGWSDEFHVLSIISLWILLSQSFRQATRWLYNATQYTARTLLDLELAKGLKTSKWYDMDCPVTGCSRMLWWMQEELEKNKVDSAEYSRYMRLRRRGTIASMITKIPWKHEFSRILAKIFEKSNSSLMLRPHISGAIREARREGRDQFELL